MTMLTCRGSWECNYLAFLASILEDVNASVHPHVYVCMCVYVHICIYMHTHIYMYIFSLFLMGKDSRSICLSLGA